MHPLQKLRLMIHQAYLETDLVFQGVLIYNDTDSQDCHATQILKKAIISSICSVLFLLSED